MPLKIDDAILVAVCNIKAISNREYFSHYYFLLDKNTG